MIVYDVKSGEVSVPLGSENRHGLMGFMSFTRLSRLISENELSGKEELLELYIEDTGITYKVRYK